MNVATETRDGLPQEKVLTRRDGNVAIVELENPNGGFLTAYMTQEIDRITHALEADPSVRAIILTGRTPGTFITHYSPHELTEIAAVVNGCKTDTAVAKLRKQTCGLTRLVYKASRCSVSLAG